VRTLRLLMARLKLLRCCRSLRSGSARVRVHLLVAHVDPITGEKSIAPPAEASLVDLVTVVCHASLQLEFTPVLLLLGQSSDVPSASSVHHLL